MKSFYISITLICLCVGCSNKDELFLEIKKNNMSGVKKLLSHDKSLINSEETKTGFRPLHAALLTGNVDMVKLLLDFDADINSIESEGERSAIHFAVLSEKNTFELVKFLLEAGANPNDQASGGETPLQLSSLGRRSDAIIVINILIKEGANVNLMDANGQTPLHYAAREGNLLAVKELIKNGAKPDMKNNFGQTPLDNAEVQSKKDVVEYLKRHLDN